MKKMIYVAFLAVLLATSFTACTDENIAPTSQENNGGGIDDPLRKQ